MVLSLEQNWRAQLLFIDSELFYFENTFSTKCLSKSMHESAGEKTQFHIYKGLLQFRTLKERGVTNLHKPTLSIKIKHFKIARFEEFEREISAFYLYK